MKALTVCEPWASAIMLGRKPVENRDWSTNYRGTLLIHAGKSTRFLCETYPDGSAVPMDRLTFGAILGTVQLTDCIPLRDAPDTPWAEGAYCWIVTDPKPFDRPIPYRGLPGLFDVPENILDTHASIVVPEMF